MKKIIMILLFVICSLKAENIYATFDVIAYKSADVSFDSSGIIENITVDIGSVVKKGDILASLKNSDIQAMIEVYQTSLHFAQKDFERQVKIKNIIDQAKFDSYAFSYEKAKAEVEYQKELLEKTILRAPFDGVIASKKVEMGDVVTPQTVTIAFRIQSEKRRKLLIHFDQKYHNSIKVGDVYKYKIDGDLKEYSGVISKIYPYADTDTRKISAEVLSEDILVGLFGDGYIVKK